jgi:hypothetical protein
LTSAEVATYFFRENSATLREKIVGKLRDKNMAMTKKIKRNSMVLEGD